MNTEQQPNAQQGKEVSGIRRFDRLRGAAGLFAVADFFFTVGFLAPDPRQSAQEIVTHLLVDGALAVQSVFPISRILSDRARS